MVLEARSPRPKRQQIWRLARSVCSSQMPDGSVSSRAGEVETSRVSLPGTNPFVRGPPSGHSHLPKALPPNTTLCRGYSFNIGICWGISIQSIMPYEKVLVG